MTSWSVPTMKCLLTTAGMEKMLEWLALVSNFVLNHHCPKTYTTLVHNTCTFPNCTSKLINNIFI